MYYFCSRLIRNNSDKVLQDSENLNMCYVDIHTHTEKHAKGVVSLYSLRVGKEVWRDMEKPYWAGIHPWDAGIADEKGLELLAEKNMSGIGEIGLDKIRGGAWESQVLWFERQLRIAADRQLPVALHVVRAHEECFQVLKKERGKVPGIVVHGFIGDTRLAERYLKIGGFLSFSLRALSSPRTVEAVKRLPLDRIFLETDDREEPIREVYWSFADLLEIPEQELKERLFLNYKNFFRI